LLGSAKNAANAVCCCTVPSCHIKIKRQPEN
jgi:hypothetical protein